MAKSLKMRVEAARGRLEKAVDDIYAAALPRMDVRFNDCFAMATPQVREVYETARRNLDLVEQEAIDKRRAYRGAFNMLTWYR